MREINRVLRAKEVSSMGLFSKLFGAKAEKEAMDVLKNITQAAVDAQKEQPMSQPI